MNGDNDSLDPITLFFLMLVATVVGVFAVIVALWLLGAIR